MLLTGIYQNLLIDHTRGTLLVDLWEAAIAFLHGCNLWGFNGVDVAVLVLQFTLSTVAQLTVCGKQYIT